MSVSCANSFIQKHGAEGIARRWLFEIEVKEFLNIGISSGVILADILTGHGLNDTISPKLLEACKNLMGDKIVSADSVQNILVEKMISGDASALGFINKIKGQIGEDMFLATTQKAGLSARLADSGSQEAWDVAIESADGVTQYIQVKTSNSIDNIIIQMQEVANKVTTGSIRDGDNIVNDISFAVPDDILNEVLASAQSLGLTTSIFSFPLSAVDAAAIVQQGFDGASLWGLGNFFQQLAGGSLTAATLHTIVSAYCMRKNALKSDKLIEEVASQTALTSGSIAAGLGVETLLKGFGLASGSTLAIALIMATALSTRSLLQRIASRRSYENTIVIQNALIKNQLMQLEKIN